MDSKLQLENFDKVYIHCLKSFTKDSLNHPASKYCDDQNKVLFYQTRFLSHRNSLKRAATKDMGFINLLLNYVLCRSPEDDTKKKKH